MVPAQRVPADPQGIFFKTADRARAIVVALVLIAIVFAGCTASDPNDEPHPAMEGREDGWEITITRLGGETMTRHVYPSERGHDFDRDGLDDLQEFMQGTDPNDPDTSGNGLLDGENIVLSYEDTRAQDWMERGIAFNERADGRLEFHGAWDWGVDPTMQDTERNGVLDGEEVGGFDVWILGERVTVQTDPTRYSESQDGMATGWKRDMGLDPTMQDTDGDGVMDTNDVNPWIDFELRLEVVSLNLTSDPEGRGERNIWFELSLPGENFQSHPQSVRVGDTTDGEAFSSPVLTPTDRGGDIVEGHHNTSFVLTGRSLNSNGGPIGIDLFSHTTGTDSFVLGAIHALTGELFVGRNEVDPWPSTATFEGEHGDITFRLVPVWPDVWQNCIDNGCRHGDGEFQWR